MINKTLIMPRKKQVRQQNIKYDNQNTKYANQNTKYANQKFTLFCREAIFVANLRTFLAYQKGQISGMVRRKILLLSTMIREEILKSLNRGKGGLMSLSVVSSPSQAETGKEIGGW